MSRLPGDWHIVGRPRAPASTRRALLPGARHAADAAGRAACAAPAADCPAPAADCPAPAADCPAPAADCPAPVLGPSHRRGRPGRPQRAPWPRGVLTPRGVRAPHRGREEAGEREAAEAAQRPASFHVTFVEASEGALPLLLSVARNELVGAAQALAQEYVDSWDALPRPPALGILGFAAAKAPQVLASAEPTAGRPERRLALQLPADAAGGASFEVRVALTSRRALQCELVRLAGAPGAEVLGCTTVDFAGALAFCTVTSPAISHLRGLHPIAFKFARAIAALVTPHFVARRLQAAGFGAMLAAATRGNLQATLCSALAAGAAGEAGGEDAGAEDAAGGPFSEAALLRDPGEAAVLAREAEVLGDALAQGSAEDRKLVWGCETWPLPHDGLLPEVALYDRLLARKLHAARGVAAALSLDATGAGADGTHVLFTEDGARAAARAAEAVPGPAQRIAMWWDPRMSVSMKRNCPHHSMDVLWTPRAAERGAPAAHVATFARGVPDSTTLLAVHAQDAGVQQLCAWLRSTYRTGSVHERAVVELLVAGSVLPPSKHRTFANAWRRRWKLVALQALVTQDAWAKLPYNVSGAEPAPRTQNVRAYCNLTAMLARHVKPPLFYVPDVFTLLVQDLWLFDGAA